MVRTARSTTTATLAALAFTAYLVAPAAAQTTAGQTPTTSTTPTTQATQPPATAAQSTTQAASSTATKTLAVPILGTVADGGTFSGTLALNSFSTQNGQLVALGTLTGVLTNAAGTATSIISNVVLPVTVGQASCQILHLDLGPLSLNLLGLQVNLSQVVLDITAQTGASNLLGNLLCSVANLLNDPSGLANLLNQILAAL